ncbi:MAG TPA: hypothetical protein VHV77_15255 [Pirellulales bacterium]|nr:hypothetical protein [Pirellulales bacterium]
MLLFFLPILGTPLAVIGMIAGSASLIYAVARTPDALRWPVMGVLVCSVAITVNLAIAYAPLGYIHKRTARSPRPIPVKAYVAPPASTNWMPVADR